MLPIDRGFYHRLLAKIIEVSNTSVGQLAAGQATDIADYRARCGYIQALEHVRQWCEDIAKSDGEPERPTT